MPTQPMTKFVAGTTLYLRQPTDEQLEAVLAWLAENQLDMEACQDGTAIFTPSGRGKSVPMVAIDFKSQVDPNAYATMAELYPAPKLLTGIVITTHEVTEETSSDRTAQLEHDLVAIGATGPQPVAQSVNPDDIPY